MYKAKPDLFGLGFVMYRNHGDDLVLYILSGILTGITFEITIEK